MDCLLDTHVFYWLLTGPDHLPDDALEVLRNPRTGLWVSAASAFEIANKVRLSKWPQAEFLTTAWPPRLDEIRARPMPLEDEDMLLAGTMVWEHRDPFDRMLASQAIRRGITLVSLDPVFTQIPGLRLLTR